MADAQDEVSRLAGLPGYRLRIEWLRHFRIEPPAGMSRDLLLRAVTYKVQEHAHGGLSQAAKRALLNLAEKITTEGASGALSLPRTIRPGVRLVREWRGQAHSVLVLDDGYEHQGQRYRSLTEIARQITGAHWSGPRFFGVTPVRGRAARGTDDQSANTGQHGEV